MRRPPFFGGRLIKGSAMPDQYFSLQLGLKILGDHLRQSGPSVAAILGPGGPSMAAKLVYMVRGPSMAGDHLWRGTICGVTEHNHVLTGGSRWPAVIPEIVLRTMLDNVRKHSGL